MSDFYLIATPIGNLSDISRRAVEVLKSVDLVLAEDTRRTAILTKSYEIDVPLMSLHGHNERYRISSVLEMLDKGKNVALVSDAGTPVLSDPGEHLVDSVIEAGHKLSPIPGASAILAALVASGFPCVPFSFYGFVPKKGKPRSRILSRLIDSSETAVFFESPKRLVTLLADLIRSGQEKRKLVGAREMTKIHEEFARGTVSEVLEYFTATQVRGEITLVLSPREKEKGELRKDVIAAEILSEGYLRQGLSSSDVARQVSEVLEISKNKAYEIVHSVMDKEEEST